jgi:hypothetical protein
LVVPGCVADLEDAIHDFIDAYNDRAKPFSWTQERQHHPGQDQP